ncbi:MAG: hypothetical protein J6J23_01135 [Clostridia bacterium]|nr:hypothetical protein [Clostridia bacterium]
MLPYPEQTRLKTAFKRLTKHIDFYINIHLRNRDSTKRKTVILKQYNALQEVNKSIFLLLFPALILSGSDVLQGLPGATVDSFKPCKALYFARAGGSGSLVSFYIKTDKKKDGRFVARLLCSIRF